MISKRFRAALVMVLLALFAAACSSGSDDDAAADAVAAASDDAAGDAAVTDTDQTEADGDADTDEAMVDDADDSTGDETSDTGDSGEDDPDAAAPVGDPVTNTTNMVRELFNIDPSPDAVDCIIAESDASPALADAIAENDPVFVQFGDETLEAVNRGINGCVDSLALGGWATEAVGPTGPARDSAPLCFANRFDDPDSGDDVFHMLIAVSFQYRYDPDVFPQFIDMMAECTPASSLSDFFAGQAEQAAGFSIEIDRPCLIDALDSGTASVDFWTTFIDGAVPASTIIDPFLLDCSVEPFEGLLDAVPADFVAWEGTGALAQVAPPARLNAYTAPPPLTIDPAASYEAVFATGGGEIRIRLFADTAPVTVNNFVSLARDGYYDGTVFHRVLDEFMAQGGDPTGTGTGGPGYAFEDEVDGGPALDRPGLLAMANSGPNTNGSQFFITFVDTDWLTGNHTVFGEVIEGQDIVDAIERRDPQLPAGRGQVLESVTIIES